MIDFIQATKHLSDKDSPFLGHCEWKSKYNSGWIRYSLEGCKEFEIWWNEYLKDLKLKGSIIYYWQGHNFTYDKKDFVAAISHIGRLLHVYLWDAQIEVFEYGVIFQIDKKPKEYIQRHSAAPKEKLTLNEKARDKGNFRWWSDSNVYNKMYDAKANIQAKQDKKMQEIIAEAGWNPKDEYIKWEAHYIKPEILNKGIGLQLCQLVNPQYESVFKEDLYLQYQRLIPMKSVIIPQDKKDLKTPDILVMEEIQIALTLGESIEEVRKRKIAFINNLPLDKVDKDARKRQINAIFKKIKESPESEWDLSEKIRKAIEELP